MQNFAPGAFSWTMICTLSAKHGKFLVQYIMYVVMDDIASILQTCMHASTYLVGKASQILSSVFQGLAIKLITTCLWQKALHINQTEIISRMATGTPDWLGGRCWTLLLLLFVDDIFRPSRILVLRDPSYTLLNSPPDQPRQNKQ
jgi:hypothetical protein